MNECYADVQKRFICRVIPDGHCLIYAWVQCSKDYNDFANITDILDEFFVLLKLEIELRTNLTYYMNFVPETVDILSDFQLYRGWKMFHTITGDILLPALSNCFRTKVFVVEKGAFNNLVPKFHLIPHSVQNPSEIQKTYYLLHTSNHYDALIMYRKCLKL